jgi:outer membrane lipoprotein
LILGGYILETNNMENETLITVIQAPLDIVDEPKSMDLTEGRFIVLHKGWLDPAVYRQERAITVAGTLIDSIAEKNETCPHPCLKIKSQEMHLVPEDYYYSTGYYWPSYNFGGYSSGGYSHGSSSGCR